MSGLGVVACVWTVIAFAIAIVIGKGIKLANSIELPEMDPDVTDEPRTWVA